MLFFFKQDVSMPNLHKFAEAEYCSYICTDFHDYFFTLEALVLIKGIMKVKHDQIDYNSKITV